MENLVDDPQSEGLVTFPDEGHENGMQMDLAPDEQLQQQLQTNGLNSDGTVKFEQKRTMNSSKSKIITNGVSKEHVSERTSQKIEFQMIKSPLTFWK